MRTYAERGKRQTDEFSYSKVQNVLRRCSVFAEILGVEGASFYKVMDEEIDPNIDPLEEFRK